MARQRFPVLQFGPFERLTTGLMNGSRRPSAVIVFFSLGASAAAGAGSFSAFPATVCSVFSGFAGSALSCLPTCLWAGAFVFCAPCLGCATMGAIAILVAGAFFAGTAAADLLLDVATVLTLGCVLPAVVLTTAGLAEATPGLEELVTVLAEVTAGLGAAMIALGALDTGAVLAVVPAGGLPGTPAACKAAFWSNSAFLATAFTVFFVF